MTKIFVPGDVFTADDANLMLQKTDLPAATTRVCASAGARDTAWGTPTTTATRLALQNSGATTIRTDLGLTERYYAAYDAATNPGGMAAAGWYPVGGADTGWVNITPGAGWTARSDQLPRVRRVGKQVTLVGLLTYASGSYSTLGTIPDGFRPDASGGVGASATHVGTAHVSRGSAGTGFAGGLYVTHATGVISFDTFLSSSTASPSSLMLTGTWFTP